MSDPDSAVRLTQNGEVDAIYNGIPDWVYEEEVLGTNTAMHTSPNGQFMLYAQFNDSKVKLKLSFWAEIPLPLLSQFFLIILFD